MLAATKRGRGGLSLGSDERADEVETMLKRESQRERENETAPGKVRNSKREWCGLVDSRRKSDDADPVVCV